VKLMNGRLFAVIGVTTGAFAASFASSPAAHAGSLPAAHLTAIGSEQRLSVKGWDVSVQPEGASGFQQGFRLEDPGNKGSWVIRAGDRCVDKEGDRVKLRWCHPDSADQRFDLVRKAGAPGVRLHVQSGGYLRVADGNRQVQVVDRDQGPTQFQVTVG